MERPDLNLMSVKFFQKKNIEYIDYLEQENERLVEENIQLRYGDTEEI